MSQENNFIPEQGQYKQLRPFQIFMKNNFPFIENTFAELDNYNLLAKVTEYLNNVISNENTVESNVTELYNAFVNLNTYVSDYFDNLDVQEEINNKLDEMATSGVLQNLINQYFSNVDEQIETFENQINNQVGDQNEQIETLESRMDSFTHLAEGSTTGDAELIDGRTAFDSRTFTNIGGNIRAFQSAQWENITESLEITEGKYITKNLTEGNFSQLNYTSFKTEKNYSYLIDTESLGLGPQIIYDKVNSIPQNVSNEGIYNDIHIIKGTGTKIYVNFRTGKNFKVYKSLNYNNNDIDIYFRKLESSEINKTEGKFINNIGTESTQSSWDYFSFIPKKGHVYYFTGATQDFAPLLYQNKPFPKIGASGDIYKYNLYKYIAISNDIIYINKRKALDNGEDIDVYESLYPIYEQLNQKDFSGIMSNCIFLGDSLTYGQTYLGNQNSYRNYFNYPYYIKKIFNVDSITEYARPGYTATQIWNNYGENITQSNSIYFVWAGTNGGLTDTVETDCNGNDYTQFADTNTGNLGKILGKIKSLDNNKIVLLNCFATSGDSTDTNNAIEDLALKYNCILVNTNVTDIRERKYHTAYNDYFNSVHFNSYGYNYIANLIKEKLYNLLDVSNVLDVYKVHE